VYGPNEYHKERMASVVLHTFNQVRDTGTMRLFKSDREGIADGKQSRDFIYVKDAASIVAHFLQNPQICGIFNVGSGEARTFSDLAENVMVSMGKQKSITWVDMPDDLQGKYQYFTQADIHKLRDAGYTRPFTSLEEGIRDYVQNYLMQADPYC
jgi:ADP-L-glycero-D-manno-heptose 6-epimerase